MRMMGRRVAVEVRVAARVVFDGKGTVAKVGNVLKGVPKLALLKGSRFCSASSEIDEHKLWSEDILV